MRIEPKMMEWLPEAQGHIVTPLGKLAVCYRKTLLSTEISVEVPAGMQAELTLAGKTETLREGLNTFTLGEGLV